MTAPTPQQFIQGQGTVSADNLNTFVQTVTNIVQLRLLIGLPGMQILLEGFVTPGDGGAGPFYWNVTSIGPDNGTSVIVPQSGVPGAWIRLVISQTSIVTLGSVANLQALDGGAAIPVVYVEGYATINDGGEGVFVYQPTDTTSPSNGGTIIIDAANHRYYRETNGNPYLVEWFGAKGDGVTDDTAAFNATLTAATLVGIPAQAQLSTAGYLIAGAVMIPSTGCLLGATQEFLAPVIIGPIVPKGPWLLFTSTSLTPVTLNAGSTFTGFVLFWPNQTDTNPPIAYPNAIQLEASGVDFNVENLFVINAYNLLTSTGTFERLHVRHVRGQILNIGLYLDGSVDVCRIDDIHIWPFWPIANTPSSPSRVYALANAQHFIFGRNDQLQCSNIFGYGGHVGMVFQDTTVPSLTGATYGSFTNIAFDTYSLACFYVKDYNGNGIIFNGIQLTGTLFGMQVLATANEPNGVISINGLSAWDFQTGILNGGNTTVTITGANIGISGPGQVVAIGPTSGTATVNIIGGNFFNYNGGPAPSDVETDPSSGAFANMNFVNCKYVAGGSTPVTSVTGAGTTTITQTNITVV